MSKTSFEDTPSSIKKSTSDDSHPSCSEDEEEEDYNQHSVIPYQIQQITSNAPSTSSHGSRNSHNSIARTKSNQSELSRIISGIRDDQHLDDAGSRYNTFGETDFILANELSRVGTNIIIQNSHRNSIGDLELQHGKASGVATTGVNTPVRTPSKSSIFQRSGTGTGAGGPGGTGASDSKTSLDNYQEIQNTGDDLQQSEDTGPRPDGGIAWLMAISAMMSMFATWGANAGFGVFLNYYLNNNTFAGATSYDYALIGGIIVCLANFISPITALMYKVFGFRIVCFIGVVVQTAGWILASYATKLWHLYCTQGVLVGVSFLLIFIPCTLVLPTWFEKQKATSMGICVSGSGLGGLIFSLSVNKVIQDTGDQRWALRMVGIVCLFAAMISLVVMKPRNYTQPPLKVTLTKEFIWESCKAVLDPTIVKIPGICIIAMWFALALMGYTLMLFSLSSYATSVGLSSAEASVLTAVMNASQIVGRPSMGLTADRIGRVNFTGTASLVIAILLYAFWINATTFGALIAFSVIIGLIIGVGSTFAQPLAADVIHPHMEKMPAAWSTINIFVSPFCLVSEVIALALVVRTSSRPYLHTQIFAGTCFFVCFLLMLLLRENLIRKFFKDQNVIMQNKLDKISGTTKSGYLKTEAVVDFSDDEEGEEQEKVDETILRERVARYNYLLRRSIVGFFVRMLYPIKI